MHLSKKIISAVLAAFLIVNLSLSASAADLSDSDFFIQQMINYYRYYQQDAGTDLLRLSHELALKDSCKAAVWDEIMDYWQWINAETAVPPDVLPDGLPEDDSLGIVVLGYSLKPHGSMKKELIGRLETALRSAEKYPDSFIICSGGGTAQYNRHRTEAGQMAQWLLEHGISRDRIIAEDRSLSTSQNAENVVSLIQRQFPQIRHLAVVTSHYHIPRACLYFFVSGILSDSRIDLVGQAAYQASHDGSESIAAQAEGVAEIAGISIGGLPRPSLCVLDRIEVYGQCLYDTGEPLALTVSAFYDNGFSRDVTEASEFSQFQTDGPEFQSITVTYEENGHLALNQFEIQVRPIPAESTAAEDQAVIAQPEPPIPEEFRKRPSPALWTVFFSLLFATVMLIARKIKLHSHR